MFDSIIMEFDVGQQSYKVLPIRDFKIDLQDENKIYWIHVNLNQTEIFQQITQQTSLSEEVIQLITEKDPLPKIIDLDDALTMRVQCLLNNQTENVSFSSLTIHLTSSICFTAAYDELPPILEFAANCKKFVRYAKTPCFILFLLLDNTVNAYAKFLFNYEIITDQMDTAVRSSHKNIYNKVIAVKRKIMHIKRYTILLREMLMRMSGRKILVISEQCRLSLYNLSNHTQIVMLEIDSIRDILNGLLDQIDNTLMQKMNESIRVLTAFASIFLPLSLITGIYGMNFQWMPELQWKYGYFYALFLIAFLAGLLVYFFKKKRWLH